MLTVTLSTKSKEVEPPVVVESTSGTAMPVVTSNFKAPTPKKNKQEQENFIFQSSTVVNLLRLVSRNPLLLPVAQKIAQTITELDKIQKVSHLMLFILPLKDSKEQSTQIFDYNPVQEEAKSKSAIESLLYVLHICTVSDDFGKMLAGMFIFSPSLTNI